MGYLIPIVIGTISSLAALFIFYSPIGSGITSLINPQEQEAMKIHFYGFPWGASDNYFQTNGSLTINVRSTTTPWNYTVIIKDRNGNLVENKTFFADEPSKLDIQKFNVVGILKPASLVVKVGGNQIFSDYLN